VLASGHASVWNAVFVVQATFECGRRATRDSAATMIRGADDEASKALADPRMAEAGGGQSAAQVVAGARTPTLV